MFSDLIITYLFLGGTGAGCCFIAAALGLLAEPEAMKSLLATRMRTLDGQPWKRFFAALYLAALGALVIGALCLMADVGRLDRVLLLLFQPMPTYIAFGVWVIIACALFASMRLLVWLGMLPLSRRMASIMDILCLIASAAVIVYTGLLLSNVQAVPLWNTPWLVVLFALSALSCGIALAFCAAFVSRTMTMFASTLMRLTKIDAGIIVIEAIVTVVCLLSVWSAAGGVTGPADSTGQAALISLESLLTGSLAALFWAGFVFVGLAVPFVQDIVIVRTSHDAIPQDRVNARISFMLGTAGCVLVGGLILRVLIVQAALHPLALIL